MITGVGREEITASMKLPAFITPFKLMENKKNIFSQVNILLFSAKWRKEKRNWLCYFPSTGKAFCFQCKLFSPEHSAFTRSGFCDWKNAIERMVAHERSKSHRDATMILC